MVGYHQDPQSLLTVADTNESALWINIGYLSSLIISQPSLVGCLVMNHSKVSHIVLNDSYNRGS